MIEISNLTKRYGREVVVNDLTLTIQKGETFGFLGQNGAGKTTAIKMIVGLARPDHGNILIGGKSYTDIAAREKIGFMPEAPYFYERLTGLEFLKFCGDLFSRTKKSNEVYEEILKMMGIYGAKDKAIVTYSKGMKQRLGFAQTMVNDPDYVFLDEPLDGLDPLGRKEVKSIIKNLKSRGKTIFFNSHILYDTEELCDKIGIIHKGKLLYSGPVGEFCEGKSLEDKFVELVEKQENE
jgi:ABC-2 type transport system ATP-binding protein